MKILSLAFVVVSSVALAGGSTGGSPGLAREELLISTVDSALNIDVLPKTFVAPSDFRRVKARLSVEGIKTVPMLLNGESIDVISLRGSVVDTNISKEVLPSPVQ